MVNFSFNRVLVLAPHTDDGEIGAGGLISALVDSGAEIKYVAFSSCAESLPPEYPNDTLIGECYAATGVLGISQEQVDILDYPVRNFPAHRQGILEQLIAVKRAFDPDLILAPCSTDIHQDHSVVHSEAVRAFKDRSLLGYEISWNCMQFRSDFQFELTEEMLQRKVKAVSWYKSQSFRGYGEGEPMINLARARGDQIGVRFAEAFEVIRLVRRHA